MRDKEKAAGKVRQLVNTNYRPGSMAIDLSYRRKIGRGKTN